MKKKVHTSPRADNEQKGVHIKILIGAIILNVICFIIAITTQYEVVYGG